MATLKQFNRIVLGTSPLMLDPFCMKQFKEGAAGFIDFDPKKFE